jgi:hypothetical protein
MGVTEPRVQIIAAAADTQPAGAVPEENQDVTVDLCNPVSPAILLAPSKRSSNVNF